MTDWSLFRTAMGLHYALLAFAVAWLWRVRRRSRRASRIGLLAVLPSVASAVVYGVPSLSRFVVSLQHDLFGPARTMLWEHALCETWLYAGLIWAVLADRPPPPEEG